MYYCDLKEAWGENNISKFFHKDSPEAKCANKKEEPVKKIEHFSEEKVAKREMKTDFCLEFLDHIETCPYCRAKIRARYRVKVLETLKETVEDYREIIVLILIGMSMMVFLNLVKQTSNPL